MNPQDFMPIIDPLDAALIPYIGDPNQESGKKDTVRSKRDGINRIIKEFGEASARLTNDYKNRIQREVDDINRIMQSR